MLSANTDHETRRFIYAREHYACAVCDDTRQLQIHHYIHRSMGGSNNPQNLVCLCSRCHALAHGTNLFPPEVGITQDELEQLIAEYLGDYYAPAWNPWLKDRHPLYAR